MKKQDDHLFKIGEIAKILGITRKTILVYEDMGLLTPAVKDENSGYRYYTADNMTQIRSIRSLQTLGLSLSEIKEYYYDSKNLDHHLERLMDLRAALDRNIQLLQVRAAKPGDLSIHRVRLPKQVCYCRRYQCKDTKDAADKLRDTYIAAARTGKMSMSARMFTMRIGQPDTGLDLMCCIPVEDDFTGEERTEFAESPALCVYYRGPYEGIGTAIATLNTYVETNHIQTTGPFPQHYLEGPPRRWGTEFGLYYAGCCYDLIPAAILHFIFPVHYENISMVKNYIFSQTLFYVIFFFLSYVPHNLQQNPMLLS